MRIGCWKVSETRRRFFSDIKGRERYRKTEGFLMNKKGQEAGGLAENRIVLIIILIVIFAIIGAGIIYLLKRFGVI